MEVRFVSGDSHHGFVIRRFASRIRYQEIRITDSYQEIRITDSYQGIALAMPKAAPFGRAFRRSGGIRAQGGIRIRASL
jgi:hypothetical protein